MDIRVSVIRAQHLPAGGQRLLMQPQGAWQVAESPSELAEGTHGLQGLGVVRAEYPVAGVHGLLEQVAGAW
jgi:hypothetical protein